MKLKYFLCTCFFSFLLSAVLCLPVTAFYNEPADWAAKQCQHLMDVGLLDWDIYTEDVSPTDAIKRGDFCLMLVNMVQMEGDWDKIENVKPVEAGYFTDLDRMDSGIGHGMHYGAAYGISDGSINNGQRVADANSHLTREQAAKMMCSLVDALETYGGVPAPEETEKRVYIDQNNISSWAAAYVDRASAMGFLKGDPEGRFNPQGTLTWQEACVMVDSAYRSAEAAVIARKAEQGIYLKSTAQEVSAENYLQGSDWNYLLEYNGNQSVLSISSGGDQSIRVETYNPDGSSAGIRNIPMELERCGGFCEGKDAYYLAFGQDNMEENNSKTVYRVVKYDKAWNRQGAADISNCYTTQPFRSTSHTAMAEENGILVLHTARLRYLTPDDGLRHQSNFTAKIRTSDMSVLWSSEVFPANHVSHSFAEYVAFDNGMPVYLDQGDAYPRGFNLGVENGQGGCKKQNFFPFYGEIGDNTTNAVAGGLGVSANHYLFFGASSPQKGNDSLKNANAFLAVIPKSGGQAQIQWMTSLPTGGQAYVNDVRLVQMNNNTFVAMWQITHPGSRFYTFDSLQYAIFDGQGKQVGETKSLPGYIMPNSDVSVYGNRILWVQPELDISDRWSVRKSRYMQIFEMKIDLNESTEQGPKNENDIGNTEESDNTTNENTGDPNHTGTGNTGDSQTTAPGGSPDPSFSTVTSNVNGFAITRTNVADGEQTKYYREDWDGNWLEVSLNGDTLRFSGRIVDSSQSRAILAAVTSQEIFITSGQPFEIKMQLNSSNFEPGKRHSVSVGTAGDSDRVWTTFRSGASLQIGLDSSGNPILWAKLPSWLKD